MISRKFSVINRVRNLSDRAQSVPDLLVKTEKSTEQDNKPKPALAAVAAAPVTGPPRFMAPGLRPVARAQIQSIPRTANYVGALTFLGEVYVADPTGNSGAKSAFVQNWSNRFTGFQQYRIRSTEWKVIPLRSNYGISQTQMSGYAAVWINDTPLAGIPLTIEYERANTLPILANTDKIMTLTYGTNEPQDLNLSDINDPPTHLTSAGTFLGAHELLIYGDLANTQLGFGVGGSTIPCFVVYAIYDIEFFGIGAF